MLILAKSCKGREFIYSPASARRVSARSAETIAHIVNGCGYQLKDGQVWHVHNVDQYDTAYEYAMCQQFRIRNGVVTDCRS